MLHKLYLNQTVKINICCYWYPTKKRRVEAWKFIKQKNDKVDNQFLTANLNFFTNFCWNNSEIRHWNMECFRDIRENNCYRIDENVGLHTSVHCAKLSIVYIRSHSVLSCSWKLGSIAVGLAIDIDTAFFGLRSLVFCQTSLFFV